MAHLDVLKGGGGSDAIDSDETLEVTIYGDEPDEETDVWAEEDYVDPDPDFGMMVRTWVIKVTKAKSVSPKLENQHRLVLKIK